MYEHSTGEQRTRRECELPRFGAAPIDLTIDERIEERIRAAAIHTDRFGGSVRSFLPPCQHREVNNINMEEHSCHGNVETRKTVSPEGIFRFDWTKSEIRQRVDALSDTSYGPSHPCIGSFGFHEPELRDPQIKFIRSVAVKNHLRGLHHVIYNILGAFCCDKVPLFDSSPGIANVLFTLYQGTNEQGE